MTGLRFCMISTFYPPWSFGGDAIHVERLSGALARRGHEVTVLHSPAAYRAAGGGAPRDPVPMNSGVRVASLDGGAGRLAPLLSYLSGRPALFRSRLEDLLGAGFDVVHFHNPSLVGAPGALGLGEGAISLYTAHEQWLVCPTHTLFKYGRRVCERPTCVRCTLSQRRPPQLWRQSRLLERSVGKLDALITPSATGAGLHQRFAGVVPIVELPPFMPDSGPAAVAAADSEPGDDPYFLYAGRLEPIKGVEVLPPAVERAGARLVIAGDGSRRAQVERLAARATDVQMLGWVDQRRLDGLYRSALAVVVPTRGHEMVPLVLPEAFARGTPAIVRDFGALGEVASRSGAALTFRTEDGLAEALRSLASDPALRASLSAQARNWYLEQWTEDRHLSGYFGLIAAAARRLGRASVAEAAERFAAEAETEAGRRATAAA